MKTVRAPNHANGHGGMKTIDVLTTQLRLPDSHTLLEELNLPPEVIHAVRSAIVPVQVFPEEAALSRQVDPQGLDPNDSPFLIAPDGNCWIDYRPIRVQYTDPQQRIWRFPRHWLNGVPEAPCNTLPVTQDIVFSDMMNLPTEFDLADINITSQAAISGARYVVYVEVRVSPDGPVKVLWRDREGTVWRIPHDWRRRRVMLPDKDALLSQNIPEDVAAACAGRIVSVNYHPGSLCCLPEHFRFRDGNGGKWPVRIADCTVIGFGDEPEFHA